VHDREEMAILLQYHELILQTNVSFSGGLSHVDWIWKMI
jgi:hypothetical protein